MSTALGEYNNFLSVYSYASNCNQENTDQILDHLPEKIGGFSRGARYAKLIDLHHAISLCLMKATQEEDYILIEHVVKAVDKKYGSEWDHKFFTRFDSNGIYNLALQKFDSETSYKGTVNTSLFKLLLEHGFDPNTSIEQYRCSLPIKIYRATISWERSLFTYVVGKLNTSSPGSNEELKLINLFKFHGGYCLPTNSIHEHLLDHLFFEFKASILLCGQQDESSNLSVFPREILAKILTCRCDPADANELASLKRSMALNPEAKALCDKASLSMQ